jgi:hypothetical protein
VAAGQVRPPRRILLVLSVLGAVALAACGDDTGAATGEPGATPTTTAAPDLEGLDLAEGSEVALGDGWTVAACESGPPLFCVHHDGQIGTQATIELLTVQAASYPAIARALDSGATTVEALIAHARDYHTTFQADRPAGCGAGYRVDPIGPVEATVGGQPGVMYGFDGHQDGRHVERNVHFATIGGSSLHIIVLTAVEDGTCMDDGELVEFTTAELTELQPRIAGMIAASTLP